MKPVLGECVGVKFEDRGDGHVLLRLLIGDWHETDFCVSSVWLNDTIDTLILAERKLEKKCIPYEGGYAFKKRNTEHKKRGFKKRWRGFMRRVQLKKKQLDKLPIDRSETS